MGNRVSLCLSQSPHMLLEGEYNDMKRKVADKRKELGLLSTETIEEGLNRIRCTDF